MQDQKNRRLISTERNTKFLQRVKQGYSDCKKMLYMKNKEIVVIGEEEKKENGGNNICRKYLTM